MEQSVHSRTYLKHLLLELRHLTIKKPPDSAPASCQENYSLRLQDIYCEIISKFPSEAVVNKLELDMWANLFKSPIDSLVNELHHRPSAPTQGSTPTLPVRSAMESKLCLIHLLDRASGVYFSLLQNLLRSLPENCWPRSVLGAVRPPGAHITMFHLNQVGQSTGRFDLNLVSFSALHDSAYLTNPTTGPSWFRLRHSEVCGSTTTTPATLADHMTLGKLPRILSRGSHLPAVSTDQVSTTSQTVSPSRSTVVSSTDGEIDESGLLDFDGQMDRVEAITYLVQHCLIHLGDAARYRQLPMVAAGYYLWASVIHPNSGHSYNQLAILESGKSPSKDRCVYALFYYYIRAISCRFPFPAASTNLRSMLRNIFSTNNQILPPEMAYLSASSFALGVLRLYAALELDANHETLINLTERLALCVSEEDSEGIFQPTSLPQRAPFHVAVVHLYFLHKLFPHQLDATDDISNGVTSVEPKLALLCYATVVILDWLVLCSMTEELTKDTQQLSMKHFDSYDAGLLLIFIWLRQQSSRNPAAINELFELHAPPFSERVIQRLNQWLLQLEPPVSHKDDLGVFCEETKQIAGVMESVDVVQQTLEPVPGSTNPESDELLDWAKLIHLPEILELQGFIPISVPTQCDLIHTTPGAKPSHPFHYEHVLQRKTNQSTFSSRGLHSTCRTRCIVQSARLVARTLPSLIEWVDGGTSADDCSPSLGHFSSVARQIPSIHQFSQAPATPTETLVPAVDVNCHQHGSSPPPTTISEIECVQSGIQVGATQNLNAVPVSVKSSPAPAVSLPDVSDETSLTISPPSENIAVAPSVPSSGGLIINAELARFIQEQAGQVAARQQLINQPPSTRTDAKSNVSGSFTGGEKTSRLCLSAAFRRDLPPRFAKRLQAELMEQEAAQSNKSSSTSTHSSSLALIPLNTPAPLARKESEAPLELNSLLDSGDGPVRHTPSLQTSLSSTHMLGLYNSTTQNGAYPCMTTPMLPQQKQPIHVHSDADLFRFNQFVNNGPRNFLGVGALQTAVPPSATPVCNANLIPSYNGNFDQMQPSSISQPMYGWNRSNGMYTSTNVPVSCNINFDRTVISPHLTTSSAGYSFPISASDTMLNGLSRQTYDNRFAYPTPSPMVSTDNVFQQELITDGGMASGVPFGALKEDITNSAPFNLSSLLPPSLFDDSASSIAPDRRVFPGMNDDMEQLHSGTIL